MQWLMLQQDHPEDFVIAPGEQYSVRDFVAQAAVELGIELGFEGDEVGVVERVTGETRLRPGERVVAVDPRNFRPADVETLLGDPAEARERLGWSPKISFRDFMAEMAQKDLKPAQRV